MSEPVDSSNVFNLKPLVSNADNTVMSKISLQDDSNNSALFTFNNQKINLKSK